MGTWGLGQLLHQSFFIPASFVAPDLKLGHLCEELEEVMLGCPNCILRG
jgi:hypothetical protein